MFVMGCPMFFPLQIARYWGDAVAVQAQFALF